MQDNVPKFLRRIRERQLIDGTRDEVLRESKPTTHTLQNLAHLSQVILVVVAVFGYFYTVRPIYQKERLAEEMAQAEGRLDRAAVELADAERRTEQSQSAAIAAEERAASLGVEVDRQLVALEALRRERDSIQNQIRYMDYPYRLPDGSPADSAEKVAKVLHDQYRSEYFEAIESSYLYSLLVGTGMAKGEPIPFISYPMDDDTRSDNYPFTDAEMEAWRTHGPNYPYFAAIQLIESVNPPPSIMAEIERQGGAISNEDVNSWKQEAIQYVQSQAGLWSPPVDPATVVSEIRDELSKIGSEQSARSQRAKLEIRQKRVLARFHADDEARKLRDSIQEHMHYLFEFEALDLPPNKWDQPAFPNIAESE